MATWLLRTAIQRQRPLTGGCDRAGGRSFRYVTDAQGKILVRNEMAGGSASRIQRYYYFDNKLVGSVGNDGPSRTDYITAQASFNPNKDKYDNFKHTSSADFDSY